MRWTEEQDEIMRELASRGAKAVSKAIKERTGVSRSESAVRMHASRIGVSLLSYERCPGCGGDVKRLNRDSGLCPTCHRKLRSGQLRSDTRETLKRIEAAKKSPEYKRAQAEFNAARRQHQRARKRLERIEERM